MCWELWQKQVHSHLDRFCTRSNFGYKREIQDCDQYACLTHTLSYGPKCEQLYKSFVESGHCTIGPVGVHNTVYIVYYLHYVITRNICQDWLGLLTWRRSSSTSQRLNHNTGWNKSTVWCLVKTSYPAASTRAARSVFGHVLTHGKYALIFPHRNTAVTTYNLTSAAFYQRWASPSL